MNNKRIEEKAYRLKKAIFATVFGDVMDSPVMGVEKEFLTHLPSGVAFSYRVDARDRLYNAVVAEVLKALSVKHFPENSSAGIHFMSINDFRTVVDRSGDREFDYDAFSNRHSFSWLCIEDMDLLSSLSSKEFAKLPAFLKLWPRRLILFGDFSAAPNASSNHMRKLEQEINIHDIDARKISGAVNEPDILCRALKTAGLSCLQDVDKTLIQAWTLFRRLHQEKRIDEAMCRFVEKTEFAAISKHGDRALRAASFDWPGLSKAEDAPAGAAGALRRLDGLVGMSNVKAQIEQLAAHVLVAKKKAEAGLPVEPDTLSFLFLGNPGTGKTTVARILAQTLRELGALKKGHLVTAHRGTLIARYLGQTAPLVTETFMSALDGVLFVDEAYSLYTADSSDDDYGREAINTLTLLMSEYAGRIAVIFAGYAEQMDYMLTSVNPGLRERFVYKITFEDYSEDELLEIFLRRAQTAKLEFEKGGVPVIRKTIAQMYANRDARFANARMMDNLFQTLTGIQETRLASELRCGSKMEKAALARLTVKDCKNLLESKTWRYATTERRPIGFALKANSKRIKITG